MNSGGDGQGPRRSVDLTVNVYAGDSPFFEATYRHLVEELSYPFRTRRVVVDRGTARGRFASAAARGGDLDSQLRRLQDAQLIDIVEDVDWSPRAIERVMARYYGNPTAPTHDTNGAAPVYQYLWAIDQCTADFVLHFDSDLLVYFQGGGAWIDESIELMKEHGKILTTTPGAGPPRAVRAQDWLLGHRATHSGSRWQRGEQFSTRYFLLDRQRFIDEVCPLVPGRDGEPLEQAITATLAARGFELWVLDDDHNWAIHPTSHNKNHVRYLDDLIRLIDAGRYPYRRTGYRWDLCTQSRHLRFTPWRIAVIRDRLGRRCRRLLHR